MSASHTYKQLSVEQHQKLFVIKFNRPAKKNALNRLAFRELMHALISVAYDDSISTIAITFGVGDYFTSGNDLAGMQDLSDASELLKLDNYYIRSLIRTFVYSRKVLVAVVNGPCIGIGFALCGLCDIVYCTENAYFEAPFAKHGICPKAGSSYVFPLILGPSKASELLYFGAKLRAQQALQFGFVADVVRYEDLDTKFWPQLMKNAEIPTCSLYATKRLMHRLEDRQKLLKALDAEIMEMSKLCTGEVYLNALSTLNSRNKSKL